MLVARVRVMKTATARWPLGGETRCDLIGRAPSVTAQARRWAGCPQARAQASSRLEHPQNGGDQGVGNVRPPDEIDRE